jgi:RNA polymerase sigma-70 factor (ECF subfamily)
MSGNSFMGRTLFLRETLRPVARDRTQIPQRTSQPARAAEPARMRHSGRNDSWTRRVLDTLPPRFAIGNLRFASILMPLRADRNFHTTHWSVVQRATGADSAAARAALNALCEQYWFPIYAFIRRSGKNAHDAEDLTQGFFARFLEKETLATTDRCKGKLRTFLLLCVTRYLADEHDRATAQKRGAAVLASFDAASAEERYAAEPVDDLTPDRLFQRRWAMTVLDQSFGLLAEQFAGEGKAKTFAALRPFLGFGPEPGKRYEEVSAQLGTPVGTLKSQVFRLRQRWKELLFEQVAQTLVNPTPAEIKAELSALLTC